MTNTWIFQTNPNTFKIDDFLKSNPRRTVWRAKQLSSRMSVGDVVFIWRSIGKDRRRRDLAGIVAEARIVKLPTVQDDRLDGQSYWINNKDGIRKEMRVELGELKPLLKRLQYDRINNDSTLSSLGILRDGLRQQSNYLLDSTHSARIRALL